MGHKLVHLAPRGPARAKPMAQTMAQPMAQSMAPRTVAAGPPRARMGLQGLSWVNVAANGPPARSAAIDRSRLVIVKLKEELKRAWGAGSRGPPGCSALSSRAWFDEMVISVSHAQIGLSRIGLL